MNPCNSAYMVCLRPHCESVLAVAAAVDRVGAHGRPEQAEAAEVAQAHEGAAEQLRTEDVHQGCAYFSFVPLKTQPNPHILAFRLIRKRFHCFIITCFTVH